MAGVVLLGASTLGAQAHFDAAAMGDWPDHKRELCYRFDKAENYANGKPDVGDDPVWVLWIEEAVKNWNDKLGGAWKLRPCTDKDKTDFIFTFSSGAETSGQGGAATGPTPFTNAAKPIKIKIRPDVTDQRIEMADGTFAAPQGGRFVNGKDTGWSKVGPKALDPVLVIMHELGHIMRLNHTVKAEKQGDLQFPVKLGQHENVPGSRSRAPSAADITHAKTAASSIAFVPRLTLEPWFGAGGLLGNSDASYVSTGNQEPFKKSVSESSGHTCGGLELGVSPFSLDGSVCTRRESRLFEIPRHADRPVILTDESGVTLDFLLKYSQTILFETNRPNADDDIHAFALGGIQLFAGLGPSFRESKLRIVSDQSAFGGGIPLATKSEWQTGAALGAGVATLVCTACVAGNPVKIGLEARVRWFPGQRVALTSPAFGFTEIGRQERTVESSLLFRVGVPFGL